MSHAARRAQVLDSQGKAAAVFQILADALADVPARRHPDYCLLSGNR
jgi:hypothetical protein